MSEWISVRDELPDVIIDSKGHCNVVLVKWAIKIECGSQYQTSNTAYVNKYPEKFTHWMPLPEPPVEQPTAHSDIERQDDK